MVTCERGSFVLKDWLGRKKPGAAAEKENSPLLLRQDIKVPEEERGLLSEMPTGFGKVHQFGQKKESYIDFMN